MLQRYKPGIRDIDKTVTGSQEEDDWSTLHYILTFPFPFIEVKGSQDTAERGFNTVSLEQQRLNFFESLWEAFGVRKKAFPFLFCLHTSKSYHLHFVSESVDPETDQCFQCFLVESLLGFISRKYKFLYCTVSSGYIARSILSIQELWAFELLLIHAVRHSFLVMRHFRIHQTSCPLVNVLLI